MRMQPKSMILGCIVPLALALAGCGGSDDRASEFVGTWTYDTVTTSSIDCGTNGTFTLTQSGDKTLGRGTTAALVDLTLSPFDGATTCNFTYNVSGPVATIKSAQSCDLSTGAATKESPNTATLSLTGPNAADEVFTAELANLPVPDSTGTTSILATCTYHVEAKLSRVSTD